jgi:hypothetical protein
MIIFTYFQLLVISIRSIIIIKLLLTLPQNIGIYPRQQRWKVRRGDSNQSIELHTHRHRLFISQILK